MPTLYQPTEEDITALHPQEQAPDVSTLYQPTAEDIAALKPRKRAAQATGGAALPVVPGSAYEQMSPNERHATDLLSGAAVDYGTNPVLQAANEQVGRQMSAPKVPPVPKFTPGAKEGIPGSDIYNDALQYGPVIDRPIINIPNGRFGKPIQVTAARFKNRKQPVYYGPSEQGGRRLSYQDPLAVAASAQGDYLGPDVTLGSAFNDVVIKDPVSPVQRGLEGMAEGLGAAAKGVFTIANPYISQQPAVHQVGRKLKPGEKPQTLGEQLGMGVGNLGAAIGGTIPVFAEQATNMAGAPGATVGIPHDNDYPQAAQDITGFQQGNINMTGFGENGPFTKPLPAMAQQLGEKFKEDPVTAIFTLAGAGAMLKGGMVGTGVRLRDSYIKQANEIESLADEGPVSATTPEGETISTQTRLDEARDLRAKAKLIDDHLPYNVRINKPQQKRKAAAAQPSAQAAPEPQAAPNLDGGVPEVTAEKGSLTGLIDHSRALIDDIHGGLDRSREAGANMAALEAAAEGGEPTRNANAEGPAPQKPTLTPINSRATFKNAIQRHFELDDERTGSAMAIADAYARAWEKSTGKPATDWYKENIAAVGQGLGEGELWQGHEPGDLYHGSSKALPEDGPGFAYDRHQSQNLYGPGFYTTDNPSIAQSYTAKGSGDSPTLYRVKWTGEKPPKMLDLEKPLPEDAASILRAAYGEFDSPKNLDLSMPGRDVYGEFKGAMRDSGLDRYEAQDAMDGVIHDLREAGYDGFTHQGGTKMGGGKVLHNVSIFFDPRDVETGAHKLKLSKVEPDTLNQPGPPETGKPYTFNFARNPNSGARLVKGGEFGQNAEPSGQYLVESDTPPQGWESGTRTFKNPLVIDFGDGYGQTSNWKNALSRKYGGKTGEALSRAIREDGHDGIITKDKYGTSEIVDLRDKPLNDQRQGRNKGSVSFLEDHRAIIRALDNPDVSTVVHELSHIFRRSIYRDGVIPQADIKVVEDWAGAKDGKWSIDAEEKFARGFERYLAEGEAPWAPKEVQDAFAKFKVWLTEIYKGITGSPIDVKLTPEVRRAFDRMLGREDEGMLHEAEPQNWTDKGGGVWHSPDGKGQIIKADDGTYTRYEPGKTPQDFRSLSEAQGLPHGRSGPEYVGSRKESKLRGTPEQNAEARQVAEARGMNRKPVKTWGDTQANAEQLGLQYETIKDLEPGQMPTMENGKHPADDDYLKSLWNLYAYYRDEVSDLRPLAKTAEQKAELAELEKRRDLVHEHADKRTEIWGRTGNNALQATIVPTKSERVMQLLRDAPKLENVNPGAKPVPVRVKNGARPKVQSEELQRAINAYKAGKESVDTLAQPSDTLFQGKNPQTDTPEFKRWFGESKVVDENGEPKVVYHGTFAPTDFSQFRTGQGIGATIQDTVGAHFGSAESANARLKTAPANKGDVGRTYPVYLKAEKPLTKPDGSYFTEGEMRTKLKSIAKKLGIENPGLRGRGGIEVRDYLRSQGYDSIPYRNSVEDKGHTSWISLDPRNIKSAIGNRGTFDPNDPNILFQSKNPNDPLNVVGRIHYKSGARSYDDFKKAVEGSVGPLKDEGDMQALYAHTKADFEAARQANRQSQQAQQKQVAQKVFVSQLATRYGSVEKTSQFVNEIADPSGGNTTLNALIHDLPLTDAQKRLIGQADAKAMGRRTTTPNPARTDAAIKNLRKIVADAKAGRISYDDPADQTRDFLVRGLERDDKAGRQKIDDALQGVERDQAGQVTYKGRQQLAEIVNRMSKQSMADNIEHYIRANLLSNPATLTKIAISHLLAAATEDLAVRSVAAPVDAAISLGTKQRSVAPPSLAATGRAALKGLREAPQAVETFWHGENTANLGEHTPFQEPGKTLHPEINTRSRAFNAAMRMPMRSHSALYRMIGSALYDRALQEAAWIESKKPGATKTAEEFYNQPEPEMMEHARDQYRQQMFANDNVVSQAVQVLKKHKNPAISTPASTQLPFSKVPINISGRAAEYHPVGAALSALKQIMGVKFGGKAMTVAEQANLARTIGRGVTGYVLTALGYELAHRHVLNAQNEDKHEYGSVNGMGRKTDVAGLAPVVTPVLYGANKYESDEMRKKGLTPPSWLETPKNFLEDNPLVRAAGDVPDLKEGGDRWANQLIGNLVSMGIPYSSAVRGIAAQTDPQHVARSKGSIGDVVKAGIPKLRETLPVALDTLGRPVPEAGNAVGLRSVPLDSIKYTPTQQKILDAWEMLDDVQRDAQKPARTPEALARRQLMNAVARQSLGYLAQMSHYRQQLLVGNTKAPMPKMDPRILDMVIRALRSAKEGNDPNAVGRDALKAYRKGGE